MQLLDDHMFKLWRMGVVDKKDILVKANSPDELAAKIARAERGLFEDEDESKRRLGKEDEGDEDE
jgi:twitching motility protein PilT